MQPHSGLAATGLSPRGRGNRRRPDQDRYNAGSIPAWAGEPMPASIRTTRSAVYPRVGGGTSSGWSERTSPSGLSPRGRGNPKERTGYPTQKRSIPAWAGEPPQLAQGDRAGRVYPRVGGGTTLSEPCPTISKGLSPRGRGNHEPRQHTCTYTGSIPAWAGEPSHCYPLHRSGAVYPRVGGGTSYAVGYGERGQGLSPRGRGNPAEAQETLDQRRSIPAWAGEPHRRRGPGYRGPVYPRVGGGTSGL